MKDNRINSEYLLKDGNNPNWNSTEIGEESYIEFESVGSCDDFMKK